MNKDNIRKIQDRILNLLPEDKRSLVGVLLTDSCSEVSRLVAGWIQGADSIDCLSILKGVNVCGLKGSHDILAVFVSGGDIYVIDSTIWQFFPKAQSILLFVSNNLQDVFKKVERKYGGEWAISEANIQISENDKKKYLTIIKKNIRENLNC